MLPVSVKKQLLGRRVGLGILAFRAPNQDWIAVSAARLRGQGWRERSDLFTDTGSGAVDADKWRGGGGTWPEVPRASSGSPRAQALVPRCNSRGFAVASLCCTTVLYYAVLYYTML